MSAMLSQSERKQTIDFRDVEYTAHDRDSEQAYESDRAETLSRIASPYHLGA